MQSLFADIEKELPLTLERETDCRETWPKRWALLKAKVENFTAPNTGSLQLLQEAHELLSMPCTTEDRIVARQKIALYLQQQQAGA